MIKKYLILVSLFCTTQSLLAVPMTAPTKASKPIPKLTETKNIDTVMTEKVQTEITKTASLKGQAVSAAYTNGKVVLQGSVENEDQEKDAIRAAKSIAGVTEVESQLTIKATQ